MDVKPPNRWYSTEGFRLGRWCARFIPRGPGLRLAEIIGRTTHRMSGTARRALEANLRAAGASEDEVGALAERTFRRFAIMLADYFLFSAGKLPDPRSLMVRWRGFEHLQRARERGKGVVLVTAHLGHWELGGILLALEGVPMTVVTLPEPDDELSAWREGYRSKLGIKTITVGTDKFAFVEIMQALRRNECVAMLVDRPYAGSGVPVRLFGQPTEFSSAPALLWEHTRAAVLPAFVFQTDDDRYVPAIEPEIEMAAGEFELNTQRVASAFEGLIREHLDQWFNFVPVFKDAEPAPQDAAPRPVEV